MQITDRQLWGSLLFAHVQHSGVNKLNTACTLYQDVDLISVAYKSNGSIIEVYFFGIKKKKVFYYHSW